MHKGNRSLQLTLGVRHRVLDRLQGGVTTQVWRAHHNHICTSRGEASPQGPVGWMSYGRPRPRSELASHCLSIWGAVQPLLGSPLGVWLAEDQHVSPSYQPHPGTLRCQGLQGPGLVGKAITIAIWCVGCAAVKPNSERVLASHPSVRTLPTTGLGSTRHRNRRPGKSAFLELASSL